VVTGFISRVLDFFIEHYFDAGFLGVIVYWLAYTIVTCSFIYFVRRLVGGWRLRDFGLTLTGFKSAVVRGLVIPAPVFILQNIVTLLFIEYYLPMFSEGFKGFNFITALVLALLIYPALTILWASFHEEFRFRGYIQNLLERELNPVTAIIGTALFFAYSHYGNYLRFGLSGLMLLASLTCILVPTLTFGLEYSVYRNLIVVMTTHTIIDGIPVWIGVAYYYYGITGGVVAAILLTIFFILTAYIAKKEVNEFIKSCKNILKGEYRTLSTAFY